MIKKTYIIIFMLSSNCYAQSVSLDSMLHLYKTINNDTLKVILANDLFLKFEYTDEKKAGRFLNNALNLSHKIKYERGIAMTYINLGYFSEDKGNYTKAINYYRKSLKIYSKLSNKIGITSSYNNLGLSYYYQGNYSTALKYHYKALKQREIIKDLKGIADSYSNIAMIYHQQTNFTAALKFFTKTVKIRIINSDSLGLARVYNNIGLVYTEQKNYDNALKNFDVSLKIFKLLNDEISITNLYNNIGMIYSNKSIVEKEILLKSKFLELALLNFNLSLAIEIRIGNSLGVAGSYYNISDLYFKQNKLHESRKFITKTLEIAKSIGHKELIRDSYNVLTVLDSISGNFKMAFENHKLLILYRDSLDNEESRKQTIQTQMTYDFEKKEAVAKAEHKKELENQKLIANEKSRKQKIVILFVVCGLLLVAVFAGFIFRSLKKTKKQKLIIEQQKILVEQQKHEVELQKELVEEKQKEVMDSIHYAKRIQEALLPSSTLINKNIRRLKKS